MKNNVIGLLEISFLQEADQERASAMSAYMKNKFSFYGIPAPKRKELLKHAVIGLQFSGTDELHELLLEMWGRPQREWQYAALFMAEKFKKLWNQESLAVFETMAINASWWDTVDTISTHCIGDFFKRYPEQKESFLHHWENSKNLWLMRVCIIHQLAYKKATDTDYLIKIVFINQDSKEFFIQKAIGWALRQYAKVDPFWVKTFVMLNDLKPLSKREALKNIKC